MKLAAQDDSSALSCVRSKTAGAVLGRSCPVLQNFHDKYKLQYSVKHAYDILHSTIKGFASRERVLPTAAARARMAANPGGKPGTTPQLELSPRRDSAGSYGMSSLDSEDVLSPTMFPTRQPHRETGASEMAGVLFSKRPGDVDGSANVSQSRWSDMSAEGAGVDELYNSRIARLEEVTAQLERTVGLQKQGMPPAPTSGGSLDVSARTHSVMSSVEI
eukprot:1532028-Rhodomonas_salina.1